MSGLLWDLVEPLFRALAPKSPVRKPPQRSAAQPQAQRPASSTGDLLPFPELASARGRRIRQQTGLSAPPSPSTPSARMREANPVPKPPARRPTSRKSEAGADSSMQAKYDAVVALMLQTHQVRVRKWRTSMSGIAWYVTYRSGHIQRLIEAPRPKGPMSAAVFLHEIGHHAIGFDVYKPRCLEEYHAWRWALEAMEAHGLNITDQVRLRVHRSLWYAVQKAKRRGIKQIPGELRAFEQRPVVNRRRRARHPGA